MRCLTMFWLQPDHGVATKDLLTVIRNLLISSIKLGIYLHIS